MMACIVVGAAVCLPALLQLHSGNLVAVFLLLPLMMGITTATAAAVCCCCSLLQVWCMMAFIVVGAAMSLPALLCKQ
jgi:hypothetical protein